MRQVQEIPVGTSSDRRRKRLGVTLLAGTISIVGLLLPSIAAAYPQSCEQAGTKTALRTEDGRIFYRQLRQGDPRPDDWSAPYRHTRRYYACAYAVGRRYFIGGHYDSSIYRYVLPIALNENYALYQRVAGDISNGGTNRLLRLNLNTGHEMRIYTGDVWGQAEFQDELTITHEVSAAAMTPAGDILWADVVRHRPRDEYYEETAETTVLNWYQHSTRVRVPFAAYLATQRALDAPRPSNEADRLPRLKTDLKANISALGIKRLPSDRARLSWQINGVPKSLIVNPKLVKAPTCGRTAESYAVIYLESSVAVVGTPTVGYSICTETKTMALASGCGIGSLINQALVRGSSMAYICSITGAKNTSSFSLYSRSLGTGEQELVQQRQTSHCVLTLGIGAKPSC